jgi:2-methylcitrate dehydratase PrpD
LPAGVLAAVPRPDAPAPLTRLAGFAAELNAAAIPPAVLQRGRWILADCVGCIVAGNRMAVPRALAHQAVARGGAAETARGESSVPGGGILSREAAAFVNGVAGTWHDLDEGNLHTGGHAGVQIVPALLAEAEATHAAGRDVLVALVAAYEVACRVYGATRARLAVHPHGTHGPLAAAIALGRLRGLDAPGMAALAAIAAGLGVAASRQTLADGATLRNVYTGLSGRNGFLALDLLRCGISGERDPLGSVFGRVYGEAFSAEHACAGLGETWMIARNYFKLHPSGRYVHSALDLLDTLRAETAIAVDDIARIEFETYAMGALMGSAVVRTAFGIRFSVPFALAARLLGADTALDDDGEAAFARADIHALARRVEVRESAAFTAAYPGRQRSVLRITLADGRVLQAAAEHIRGEAELPHSEADLARKFLALTKPSLGSAADIVLRGLLEIDTIPDYTVLARQMGAAAGADERAT